MDYFIFNETIEEGNFDMSVYIEQHLKVFDGMEYDSPDYYIGNDDIYTSSKTGSWVL